MCKLNSVSRVLNRVSIIALLAAILMLAIPAGIYFATGIEMLWLVNAAVVISFGSIACFAAFIAVVTVTWIKDSRESDDECDVEVTA